MEPLHAWPDIVMCVDAGDWNIGENLRTCTGPKRGSDGSATRQGIEVEIE